MLDWIEIAIEVLQPGIDGYRHDGVPRAEFSRQLEGADDVEAAGNPSEYPLLLGQAASHVAGFTFIDAARLVVGGGIQQRRNKADSDTLDMMISDLAGGDDRARSRFKGDDTRLAVGLA